MVTVVLLLVAIALLVWGFIRARPAGQIGLLAWLQSVVLMAPWLVFFGVTAFGIYPNLVVVLFLVVASAGGYILLGRRLRFLGQQLSQQPSDGTGEAVSLPTGGADRSAAASEETSSIAEANQTNAQVADGFVMPASDRAVLEGIFGIDTFFRTETVPYGEGVIFKGNLRGEPEAALQTLTALANERLDNRYRLFLVADVNAKPVVVALPKTADPQPLTPLQKGIAGVLAIATLLTCLEASGILLGFDLLSQPENWRQALPFAIGIFAILVGHELGHWWVAQRRGVRLSLPFFIPTWEIGSFGALTRIESILPDRATLFDIAFAGPALGGVLSLGMLIVGLVLSHPGSMFQLPTAFFQGSALVSTLAKIVLGSALSESIVDVHPLTLVGWLGLVITALNLVPAGQLDGGRIVQAIYGRKTAARATIISLVILAIASLTNPLALYWAALILFLQRNQERPALNELTELDDARAALGLLLLFLSLATLLPLTPSLAGRLGIG